MLLLSPSLFAALLSLAFAAVCRCWLDLVSTALRSFSGDFHLLTDISGDFSKASQCQSPPSFVVQIEHPTERERVTQRERCNSCLLRRSQQKRVQIGANGAANSFYTGALSLNLHGLNEAKETKWDFFCLLINMLFILWILINILFKFL